MTSTTLPRGSAMSSSAVLPQKRKLPLAENEKKLYDLIWSKGSAGMWIADMKKATGLPHNAAAKALKSLQAKNFIKVVADIHKKVKSLYLAVEFEPSEEISGGAWYSNGSLDLEYIRILREQCRMHVERLRAATVENVWQSVRDSRIFTTECTMQQIKEIMGAMVLEREIEELTSSGIGEFSHIQVGRRCYRSRRGRAVAGEGFCSSVPCGVCPRIAECTPDGLISPQTCVYYNKWLGLEF